MSRKQDEITKPTYHRVLPIDRAEVEAAFASGDSRRICDALVSAAFYDSDWLWVQDKCLHFVDSSFPDARRLSIVCFGHLARIHGKLEMNKVLPVLEKLRDDAELGEDVAETFEDIEFFINDKKCRARK
ncbi:MAG TPA: hypothetical protein VK400_06055 [Pyrinomonadaceae bacterium]|nr:hypothetical protein [Pyrinomonadaceae bacterium]